MRESKYLSLEALEFEVDIEGEDTPLKGNVMSSGDADQDRDAENEVRAQLADGNEWAWCTVVVRATYRGYESIQYRGCCSYASEAQFMESGYFQDTKAECYSEIIEMIKTDIKEVFMPIYKEFIRDTYLHTSDVVEFFEKSLSADETKQQKVYECFTCDFNHSHHSYEAIGLSLTLDMAVKVCEDHARNVTFEPLSEESISQLYGMEQTQGHVGEHEYIIRSDFQTLHL